MGGVEHTFSKCPFCQTCNGIEIGSCPNGTMLVEEAPAPSCAGYENCGSYKITYQVSHANPKLTLRRVAYLPNNPEGTKVLGLLRTAWDRRLTFSVGTSMTTGATDVPVWNIHHKTGRTGGVEVYSYPDPTYLTRVQSELKQYGIE